MHTEVRLGPTGPDEAASFHDATTGTRGAIVLHSTAIGPAAGRCRLAQYSSDKLAIADALRLAEGMPWNAPADPPFGGAKGVLRVPDTLHDRFALFRAVGRATKRQSISPFAAVRQIAVQRIADGRHDAQDRGTPR